MSVSQSNQRGKIEQVEWGGLTWIDIEEPTEIETKYLSEKYPFHKLDLDDCLSRIQRPKIDEYEDYLFVVLHFPLWHKETQTTSPSQVSVFIGKGYLITLHEGKLTTLVKLFQDCQFNEESRKQYFSHGSGYLLYRILDHMTDAYFPVLDRIMARMEAIEDKVFDEKAEVGQELATLRRNVLAQRRIVWPLRTVFTDLGAKLQRFADMALNIYWDDLMDHIHKVWDLLDEYKEVIEVFVDSDASLSSYRVNRALRILTVVMTIGTILTVVVGYFGMNIPLFPLGSNPGGSPFAWLIILLFCMFVSVGMAIYFHREGWL